MATPTARQPARSPCPARASHTADSASSWTAPPVPPAWTTRQVADAAAFFRCRCCMKPSSAAAPNNTVPETSNNRAEIIAPALHGFSHGSVINTSATLLRGYGKSGNGRTWVAPGAEPSGRGDGSRVALDDKHPAAAARPGAGTDLEHHPPILRRAVVGIRPVRVDDVVHRCDRR